MNLFKTLGLASAFALAAFAAQAQTEPKLVHAAMMDSARSGLNNFTGLVPAAGAFELPFMFPDRDAAYAVLDG